MNKLLQMTIWDVGLLWAVRVGLALHLLIPLVQWRGLLFPLGSTKAHAFLLLSELTVVLYLWLASRRKEYAPRIGSVGVWLYVFIGALAVATVFGIDPLMSFYSGIERSTGLLFWFHLGALYAVLTGVLHSRRDWNAFLAVAAMVATLVSLAHLSEVAGLRVVLGSTGGSTIGNSSFFGAYLLLNMMFVGVLAVRSTMRRSRLLVLSVFVLLVMTLLSTTAYASIYAFFGGGVLFAALALWQSARSRAGRLTAAGLVVALVLTFVSIVTLAFVPGSAVREAIIDQTGEARFVVWDIALEGVAERPVFGWGPENVPAVITRHYDPCFGSLRCDENPWFDRVHSKPLDLLLDAGLVGLMVFVLLWAALVRGLFRRLREGDLAASVLLAGLAAYVVQNLTVFDSLTVLLMWIVALALVGHVLGAKKAPRQVATWVPATATILLPVALVFFVALPFSGHRATVRVLSAPTAEQRLELYEVATTRSGYGIDFRRAFLANETGNALWRVDAVQAATLTELFTKEIALTERANLQTIGRAPHYLRSYIHLAYVYQGAARYFDGYSLEDAQELLKRGLEVSPDSHELHWALAAVYLEQGRTDEALALTSASLAAGPEVVRAQKLHTLAQQMSEEGVVLALLAQFY